MDDLARACVDALYREDVAAQRMGIEIDEIRPGYARLRMSVREDMVNGHGVAHGGVVFSFADTAFAYACNGYNDRTLATACTIDYIRPTRVDDRLIATATEHWRSSRTGVYDVEVKREDGELVAVFRGKSFSTGQAIIER